MRKLLFVFLCVVATEAQSGSGLRAWGEFQNDLVAIQTFNRELSDQFGFTGIGMLTLNAANKNTTNFKIEASADLMLLYGAYANMVPATTTTSLLQTTTEGPVLFNLRKLYAGFFLPFGDLFVGRQIINYGQGLVFTPIDVFSTVDIFDLTYKRTGSDVVRLRMPLGATAGAEVTAGLASLDRKPLAALKVYGNLLGIDLAGIGIYKADREQVITGLTFKGDLGAGIYGELVEHFSTTNLDNRFSGMLGLDYSIGREWLFNAEYLYNQLDSRSKSGLSLLSQVGDTSSQFGGEHNLFGSVRYAFNELSSLGLSGLANIDQRMGFLTGQYSYNFLQNANLIFYSRYLYTDQSRATDAIPDMQYGLRLEASF